MDKIKTDVPKAVFTDQGLKTPDEIDILSGVFSDLSSAMGGAMSNSLTTPQGQIATSNTAVIEEKNSQLALLANQINPDFSSGRFQDAIGRIYFIERKPALSTAVVATCTGLVGTVIPMGCVAQDNEGYLYYSTVESTIPASGSIDVVFQNGKTGAIACPQGSLNTIYKAVSGWSGIINQSAGVPGSDVESRANFEYRRRQSVAKNAKGTNQSVQGAVLEVENVIDAYVIDNPEPFSVAKGYTNYVLKPHSLYVCVSGGDVESIAKAIFTKKSQGCAMNGDTFYTLHDEEGYQPPYPEYTIQWQTASTPRVYFQVKLKESNYLPADIIQRVKKSVMNAFNGEDGGTRARIGATLNSGRYYAGVYEIDTTNINIQSIEIKREGGTYLSSLDFGIDEIPTLDENDVYVEFI